jgi:CubicO group peptidase (beta-lactamase class C family)
MRYSSQELKLVNKIKDAIQDVTPGVVARAYHFGRLVCDVAVGTTYPYYDLASLTKIIFTQQAMMEAFDKGCWHMESKVKDFILGYEYDTSIKELLTHTSGLEWWRPFYQEINLNTPWLYKRDWILKSILKSELKRTEKAVYSDLGFILLGFVLEDIYKKNILDIWLDVKEKYYPTTTLEYHVENKTDIPMERFAPTEDCPWRKRILKGEVHDENAWSFGGISTHSGLFGSVEDVSAYGLNLRSQLQGIARYNVRQKTAQLFAQRAVPIEVGDWAMGYMMPSLSGASCGPHFSVLSIGHTGFTGTSCWYDPRNDLLVVILSNRVHYGRENKGFVSLRPQIHTWIYETLKKG